MDKIQLVDNLIEKLEEYNNELMESEQSAFARERHYDGYVLDDVLNVKKMMYEDGTEEGRIYESFILKTESNVRIYDVVEVERLMSKKIDRVQVMSIEEIFIKDNHILVEFLGKVVNY